MASDILVKVGADITDFSKKMAESNKALGNFTKANQETFDAFKKTGAAVTGVGVALAGGLGVAVKHAANFESAMSSVAAISGATGKDLDLLTEAAREWGASTSFSATEAAEGLEYMALAGWDTQQMLGGIGPILHLAEAGALELGRASDLVTDSMSAMGIEVQNLDGYLDKVAQTSRKSNTDIDALMEALVIAGGKFRELNIPLEESNAMLGILANRGFKGSEAGTAMNAILTRLTATTGPSAKALKELGVSAFDSQGNFRGMEVVMKDVEKALSKMDDEQRSHYQTQIAGLNHGKAFSAMLDGLGNEYDSLKGDIEGADGALIEMRDTMKDNLQGALENLSSAFEEIMISLGEALLPAVKTITKWLQKLADWFNGLSDSTKSTIAIVAGVATVLMLVVGPMLLLIGFIPQIIAGFKTVITVFTAVSKIFRIVRVAMLLFTSPIGLIIAAVVGLAYLIYKYWDEIKAVTQAVWGAITDFLSGLWDGVKEAWNSFIEWVSELWESLKEITSTAWTNIKESIVEIWNSIVEFFTGVWDWIVGVFQSALNWIDEKTNGKFSGVLETITGHMEMVWGIIKDVWKYIKDTFKNALKFVKSLVTGDFEGMKEAISDQMENARKLISNIWNRIKDFFGSILGNIWTTIKNKFTDIVNSARDKMNEAKQKIEDAWNKAVDFLKNIDLLQIGKDIIQGLIDGIVSMGKWVKDAIANLAGWIPNWIKEKLGIASPSRVTTKLGEYIGQGLAKGITQSQRLVERATEKLAEAATPDMRHISMDYATPSGSYASLASAVSGTVDVRTRDDMLATAIGRLERRLGDLEVVMDGRVVGRIVEPHVTEQQDRNKRVINGFRG